MLEPYLIWFIAAGALITVEAITPGVFVFLFFGIAALINAGICYFFPELSVAYQAVLFLVVSMSSMLLFRKNIRTRFFNTDKLTDDSISADYIGKKAVAIENFNAGMGKVSFNGTSWNAMAENQTIKKDDLLKITAIDNLTLTVKPFNS